MVAIRAAGFFAQQKQRRAAQGIKRCFMSRGPQCCGPDLPVSPTQSDDREPVEQVEQDHELPAAFENLECGFGPPRQRRQAYDRDPYR